MVGNNAGLWAKQFVSKFDCYLHNVCLKLTIRMMFTRNYRLLAYFVEVVACGSVRGAARNLFVSAPVVSKALADLEASLSTTLLTRDKHKLNLTDEGKQVYAYALDMTQAAVNALSSISNPGENIAGHLDINLPTELASAWLPSVLKRFSHQHPAVSIEVIASDQTNDRQQQQQVVIRSDFNHDPPSRQDGYFSYLPLCIVCSPELVSSRKKSFQRQLDSISFIGFSQTDRSNTLSTINRKSGRKVTLKFKSNTYVNNAQVIKEMALRGYGAGQLTEQSVEQELASGRLVKLGQDYDFGYICQRLIFRDQYPSPAARAFRDLVTE